MSSRANLEDRYQQLLGEREQLAARYEAGELEVLPEIQAVNTEIRAVLLEIDALDATVSTGNMVLDNQLALGGGGTATDGSENPNISSPTANNNGLVLDNNGRIVDGGNSSGTNAVGSVGANSEDSGLNGDVVTTGQSQSVPIGGYTYPTDLITTPVTSGASGDPGGTPNGNFDAFGTRVTPNGTFGAGAKNDDVGSRNLTRNEIDNIFTENQIIPRPNVLNQYASYTYSASVYLMTENGYKTMMQTKRKSIPTSQLLFQSGGAPTGGRNRYFSNDYYIDKFDLKSAIIGKASGMTHNVKDIRMTVVEPNGITFLDNLDKAIQDFYGNDRKTNLTAIVYLLVIRFYGYDDSGNLVRGGVPKPDGSSDPNAFIEKFYPFLIKNVKFKIANKLVEYEIEASGVHYQINTGQGRGTIPFNIELSGQTVKDVLSGPSTYSANQTEVTAGGRSSSAFAATDPRRTDIASIVTEITEPAPNAGAAPKKTRTVRQGLMAAMNDFQQQLVRDGVYTFADDYQIEFVGSAIQAAKVKKAGNIVKSSTSNATPGSAADQLLPSKQSMDPNSRTMSATAGMQIVQLIDQIVRNSSFIEDQQLYKYDEKTQEYIDNGTPAQNVAWFKISLEATAKLDQGIDPKRNDYAYSIKYIVSPYKITQLNSEYFPTPRFTGVQKDYQYWFTGQNTAVINYEENLNGLYYLTLSGTDFGINTDGTGKNGEQIKYSYQSRSVESSQGAEGKTNEAVANAAEQLFSPADLKEATVTIVGDPAWLQQGEAFAGQVKSAWNFGSFLPDGTLNFDSGQILFRIAFNAPADYDMSTGLIQPGSAGGNPTQAVTQGAPAGPAQINRVYIAKECISSFSRGKFTQVLKGSLLLEQSAADNAEARSIANQIKQAAIYALSPNRQRSNLTGSLGSVSLQSFLSVLPSLATGKTTPAQLVNRGLAALGQNVLGGGGIVNSTINKAVSSVVTSVGQDISRTVNSAVGSVLKAPSTLPGVGSTATPPFNGAGNSTASVDDGVSINGTDQPMSAGDDSGIDTSTGDAVFTNDNIRLDDATSEVTSNDLFDFFG
jgi:hypothetical protein